MKWIEVIKLRSEPARESDAVEWLSRAVQGLAGTKHLLSAVVCSRVDVAGDTSVHLEWEAASITVTGSDVGLGIAHALGGFGLLDHSVWAERRSEGVETAGAESEGVAERGRS